MIRSYKQTKYHYCIPSFCSKYGRKENFKESIKMKVLRLYDILYLICNFCFFTVNSRYINLALQLKLSYINRPWKKNLPSFNLSRQLRNLRPLMRSWCFSSCLSLCIKLNRIISSSEIIMAEESRAEWWSLMVILKIKTGLTTLENLQTQINNIIRQANSISPPQLHNKDRQNQISTLEMWSMKA